MLTIEDTDQIRKCGFQNKPYRADVQVTVADIATAGDALIPMLSTLATGQDSMTDVSYEVVDFKGDAGSTLVVAVKGNVAQVIEDMNAAQVSA